MPAVGPAVNWGCLALPGLRLPLLSPAPLSPHLCAAPPAARAASTGSFLGTVEGLGQRWVDPEEQGEQDTPPPSSLGQNFPATSQTAPPLPAASSTLGLSPRWSPQTLLLSFNSLGASLPKLGAGDPAGHKTDVSLVPTPAEP